jgi:hypothetical protein
MIHVKSLPLRSQEALSGDRGSLRELVISGEGLMIIHEMWTSYRVSVTVLVVNLRERTTFRNV